jgi:O-antigen/teichoic acid export membrane protein
LSQVITAVTGALTTLLLARILGPAGAGAYAIALTLTLGLMTLGTLSLQNGISVLVAGGRWSPRTALVQTQYVAVALGLIAVGAGLAVFYAFPAALHGLDLRLVLIASLSVPFGLSWTFASAVALAVDHYELYAAPPVFQSTLGLVVLPALAAVSGIEAVVIGLAGTQAVTAFVTVLWSARSIARKSDYAPLEHRLGGGLRAALSLGLKTHLANVLSFFNYRLDLFILNATASGSQVGQYSIAVSVTQAIWLMPRALNQVVTPRVAHAHGRREALGNAYLDLVEGKSLRHTTLLSVGSALAALAALAVLVFGFLGPGFRESFVLGLILLPGSTMLALAGALAAVVIGRGRPEYSMWGALITTPTAIVLYVVLVPPLNAVGAALASSISYGFGLIVAIILYNRMIGPGVLRRLVPRREDIRDYGALIPRRRRVGA